MAFILKNGIWRPNQVPYFPVDLDRQHPLSNGLLAFWLLNNLSGIDLVGASPLSGVGGPTIGTSPRGPAATLDGSSQCFGTSSVNILNPTGGLTLSAWVRSTAATALGGAYDRIIDRRYNGGYVLGLEGNSGKALLGVGNGGATLLAGTTVISNDQKWHHVLGTWTPSLACIYLDGVLENSVAPIGSISYSADPVTIGADNTTGPGYKIEWWPGSISDVKIYGRALSANEVTRLYLEPFAMLKAKVSRQFYFMPSVSGGGSPTGSAAWTEAQDTWAGTGGVLVSGTAAWTEAKDTWAGTGGIYATGTVSWTEGNDSWSASGAVTTGPTGSVAWTEAKDTWVGTGGVAISGSASWTEAKDNWAVAGSITLPGVTGTVAWTEGPDLWAGVGSNGLIWTPVAPTTAIWTPQIPGSTTWTPVG